MNVRSAEAMEVESLARIWYDGWQDAHARIVLAGLARVRTLASFHERIEAMVANVRVVGMIGDPIGFSALKGDELYQLYVAAAGRGSGIAAALIADAEEKLAGNGVELAWLTCAIGNDRAARFYEKSGWRRTGTVVSILETLVGEFPLEVWRYEKRVGKEG